MPAADPAIKSRVTTSRKERDLIAIVDDHEMVARAIEAAVISAGYEVARFGSCIEFLKSPQLSQTTCLILDIAMPEMDGLELQKKLIADGHHIPIIFISGEADVHQQATAWRAGAKAFLHKPVGREDLVLAIRAALSSCPEPGVAS